MSKNHNYFDFIIGTMVLVVAFLFFFSSFEKTHKTNSNTYSLYAKFTNIEGINAGADVKISGVKIGTVSKQQLDNSSYKAVVYFDIDNNIKIPADSSIKVSSEGLLGSKYLAISVGSDEDFLQQNQEIPFTQSSVSFEDLLAKFIFNSK